jgi:hypothetical protein
MIQPEPNLTPTNIEEDSVYSNPFDVRHDVHAFIGYVQDNEIKRSHRSNELSAADTKRLAKLMSHSSAIEELKISGVSSWVNYVDELALLLKFVKYDTEGRYAGYSSSEPSFSDNYIKFDAKRYEEFIDLPLIEQEKKLQDILQKNYIDGNNEFYVTGVLGRLTGFPTWGSRTGIIPGLDFAGPRRFLIDILQYCKAGVWYTTSSLIQYLKKHHPFFLIPQKPKYEYKHDAEKGRYGNFYEKTEKWGDGTHVPERDADAFERVEGRYVERFLEGLPLNLGYIEVAYSRKEYKGTMPEMGQLLAFRINDKFLRVINGEIKEPRVIVQPNFEIHVESELYPARILSQLTKFADVVAKDRTSILKLQKKKVLTQLSQREGLDVIKLLENMSGKELSQNVRIELEEWAGVSEAFTLYENVVLLEGEKELADIDQFTIESISPAMRIVHSPDRLFKHLEEKELIPLQIKHHSSAFVPLPEGAHTVFPKQEPGVSKSKAVEKAKAKTKKPVTIKREVQITYRFLAKEFMEEFHKGLIAARCPVAVDWSKLTLSFASQYEPEVKKVSKALNQDYTIKIEDVA